MALCAEPSYVSHIVGMSRAESLELLQRVMRLCEVPEYQLRLPWHSETDIVILTITCFVTEWWRISTTFPPKVGFWRTFRPRAIHSPWRTFSYLASRSTLTIRIRRK